MADLDSSSLLLASRRTSAKVRSLEKMVAEMLLLPCFSKDVAETFQGLGFFCAVSFLLFFSFVSYKVVRLVRKCTHKGFKDTLQVLQASSNFKEFGKLPPSQGTLLFLFLRFSLKRLLKNPGSDDWFSPWKGSSQSFWQQLSKQAERRLLNYPKWLFTQESSVRRKKAS